MHFIIFDLEATCWQGNQDFREREVIEIGAIKSDHYGHRISDFQAFVRPVLFPDLSPYCVKLTGITQADIDGAAGFRQVIKQFRDWCESGTSEYTLCSWGSKDLEFLYHDCELHSVDASWLDTYIDLKEQYHDIFNIPQRMGLKKSLRFENIPFEGQHHRALDDAENLFSLFDKHRDVWMY